jgi:hypothetical protein
MTRIHLFTLMRIRILPLVKMMQSATTGLQKLQASIVSVRVPRLHFEPLKLMNFYFKRIRSQQFTYCGS